MSTESPGVGLQLKVCPSCGAAVASDAKACWLCKWDLAEEIVTAEVVGEPPDYVVRSTSTHAALIAGIITLGVVTVGVFAAAPGIGVVMGIGFVIAIFAVAQGLQSDGPIAPGQADIAQAYASPATVAKMRRGSVAADVFKVLGVIALIGLASIIAFFTFCVICIVVLTNA